IEQVEYEAFEVGRPGYIHGWAGGGMGMLGRAWPIHPRAEELFKHVVLVGGQHQPAYGQAHLPGDVSGQDVAEIARRHTEGHTLAAACGGAQPAPEVVHDLGRNTGPIDRVDRAYVMARLEIQIARQCFHDVLAFVEYTVDGDVVDVFILQRIHLRTLELAHAALRRQHEDRHTTFAAQRVLCRRTGVAGRGAQDV